jgi:hypothetical protein
MYWYGWLSGAATVSRVLAQELHEAGYIRRSVRTYEVAEIFEGRAGLLLVEPEQVIKVVQP